MSYKGKLFINKSKSADALCFGADKLQVCNMLMHYVLTMVEDNDNFSITITKEK